jgi:hypothetical protein
MLPATTYSAWAVALAQGYDELLGEVDPERLDPRLDSYRHLLARFDRWNLEQEGQRSFDAALDRRPCSTVRRLASSRRPATN